MTLELSVEENITRILSAEQILKVQDRNYYISNPLLDTLSDFLDNIEPEQINLETELPTPAKYVFIKC